MCGISIIINKDNAPVSEAELRKMNSPIRHRGPNDEGYFCFDYVGLGFQRLSILDLSPKGHQPMTFMDRYVLVFNGEIYNYLELKELLQKEGYIFQSQTDSEVILAAYAKWGEECVHHFNGMWAFGILDKQEKKLFASRDRFGVKPFYYTLVGNRFLMASEIKQFTVFEEWRARLNPQRASDFLLYGILDHTSETIFQGVYSLRGGENIIYNFSKHRYTVTQWYNLPNRISSRNTSLEEAQRQFYSLFQDAVKLRLRSDVPVGSSLSGGLDSSSIVAEICSQFHKESVNKPFETVTSCFENPHFDERQYVDALQKRYGFLSHRVFPRFEELFSTLDDILWKNDEPFSSTSIFASWNVFRKAKEQGLTVMLDGQGSDEYLAGYPTFYGGLFVNLLKKGRLRQCLNEMRAYHKTHGYSYIEAMGRILNYFLPSWVRKDVKSLAGRGMPSWIKQNSAFFYSDPIANLGQVTDSIEGMSLAQIQYTSLPMILHWGDRLSMSHSIETRYPFLDYRLVEYALGLQAEYKLREGVSKIILRKAMTDILPQKIVNRMDKMGFVTPESEWLLHHADTFERELKASADILSFWIDKNKLLNWFQNIIQKKQTSTFLVWRVICMARWMNVFGVQNV